MICALLVIFIVLLVVGYVWVVLLDECSKEE